MTNRTILALLCLLCASVSHAQTAPRPISLGSVQQQPGALINGVEIVPPDAGTARLILEPGAILHVQAGESTIGSNVVLNGNLGPGSTTGNNTGDKDAAHTPFTPANPLSPCWTPLPVSSADGFNYLATCWAAHDALIASLTSTVATHTSQIAALVADLLATKARVTAAEGRLDAIELEELNEHVDGGVAGTGGAGTGAGTGAGSGGAGAGAGSGGTGGTGAGTGGAGGTCASPTDAGIVSLVATSTTTPSVPLGINVGRIAFGDINTPFTDTFRGRDLWQSTDNSAWTTNFESQIPRDADQYPLQLPVTIGGKPQYLRAAVVDALYSGTWVLLYDGTGTFSFPALPGTVGSSTPGRITLNITADLNAVPTKAIFVEILSSSQSDHVRNIRLLSPGHESDYLTVPFDPNYLATIQGASVLRMVDWTRTNFNPTTTWASRTLATWGQGSVYGASLETQIDLCNAIASDCWFNVPEQADDTWITSAAALIHSRLLSTHKAYVEYTNEPWNPGFSATSAYLTAQGVGCVGHQTFNDGGGGGPYNASLSFDVYRSGQIFEAFATEFGGTSRLVRVAEGQSTNAGLNAIWLARYNNLRFNPLAADPYSHPDVLAVAPYFGGVGNAVGDNLANETVATVLTRMSNTLATSVTTYVGQNKTVATNAGVRLIAYEGGQSLVGVGPGYIDNASLTSLLTATNRDVGMYSQYSTYFGAWDSASGGELMVSYSSHSSYDLNGSWGHIEKQPLPTSQSGTPKYQAWRDWLTTLSTPVCSTACDNGLYCDGVETCGPGNQCVSGIPPCSGQSCTESTDSCSTPAGAATITLAPATQYQTLNGWATSAYAAQHSAPAVNFSAIKTQLFDLAVNHFGLTRLKIGFTCGVEGAGWFQAGTYPANPKNNYVIVNDDGDPNTLNTSGFVYTDFDAVFMDAVVMPIKALVEATGQKFWLTAGYICAVDAGSTANPIVPHATNPSEYAEFVYSAVKHLWDKYQVIPDEWTINEPDWQARAFNATVYGNSVEAAITRLLAERTAGNLPSSFVPHFTFPETTSPATAAAFWDTMLSIIPANHRQYISGLAYHWYSTPSFTDTDLANNASRGAAQGVPVMMWESGAVQTPVDISMLGNLYRGLTVGNVSGFHPGTLAGPGTSEATGKYFGINTTTNTVVEQTHAKWFESIMRYARSGAVRIGATSSTFNIRPLAFINPTEKYAIPLLSNTPSTAAQNFIACPPPGLYGLHQITVAQIDGVDLPDQTTYGTQCIVGTVPAGGTITIYRK
jgi:hypothetical protein